MMKPRISWGAASALLGGCAGLMFTEADQGQTKEISRGASFTISLPAAQSATWAEPKIQGTFIRLVDRHMEASTGREVFEFKAERLGEGDLRIPPLSSSWRIKQE